MSPSRRTIIWALFAAALVAGIAVTAPRALAPQSEIGDAVRSSSMPGSADRSSSRIGDAGRSAPASRPERPDRVLVRFRPSADGAERADAREDARTEFEKTLPVRGLQLVDPGPGVSVDAAVDRLEREPAVLYAEPDAPRQVELTPNDSFFSALWGLHNTGQPVAGGPGGTPDADIDAPEAWDLTTGDSGLAVGVIDTGVDASHPDLSPNRWTNSGESGSGRETNGLDDDGNGVADDVHGYDFVANDGSPDDANGHGTHVAGTLAARGNDGQGVAGVSWSSGIVPLRVLGADGTGFVSDAIDAYGYAQQTGLRVVNASLGGAQGSQAERDAISAASGTLFVVAAGNGGADDVGDDNDATGEYPCSYDLSNIVCVAATDPDDRLAGFSNYGARSVDLAAPGVNIGSTYPASRWVYMDGTSMAAPHVAGAAALVLARSPDSSVARVREVLLANTDAKASLAGKTATGGRLNVHRAVVAAEAQAAPGLPMPEPPTPEPPTATPADLTAPSLSISAASTQRQSAVVRRGLRPLVGTSEPSTVTATLEVSARIGRRLGLTRGSRPVRIGTATIVYTGAGARRIVIRLKSSARRRLGRLRSVPTTLRVRGVDGSQNEGGGTKRITLLR